MPTARSGLSSLKTNGIGYVAISETLAAKSWEIGTRLAKQVPPSGHDQHLYPFGSEHLVIRDKQENFGIYKVADGGEVWHQTGVKRFGLTKNVIALCKSDGVEIWRLE